jgi:integrase
MAGRIPHPWFREGKGAWFVHIDGRQINLGKDKEEAFRKFHGLMAGRGQVGAETDPSLTAEQLVRAYLADGERRLQQNTLRVTRIFLEDFSRKYGKTLAKDVRRFQVEQWVQGHPTWNPSTENLAKTKLVALFHWGVAQGLLSATPIRGIRKPPQRSRGVEAVVSPEHLALILNAAESCFRNVLLTLYETGARPGEVTSVTASEFFPDQGAWVLRRHKNAHKGQSRVVYLTPRVTALCMALAEKYPTGPLYRNQWGRPYGRCGLSKRLSWLCQRLGLPKGITVYGLRHSFATDSLAAGVPDAVVAELLGHSGTAMLHRHYSHLTAKTKVLKEALGRVRGAGTETPNGVGE